MSTSKLTQQGMNLPQQQQMPQPYAPWMQQQPQQQGQEGQQPVAPQFDINAMMAAFLQQQAQTNLDRTKLQRERSFGRNIGWQGPGGLTPQADWDSMFPSGASQLTPEARMASQGPSAMTQWAQRGQMKGVDPNLLNDLMPNPNPTTIQHSPQSLPQAQQGNYRQNDYGSGYSGYVGPAPDDAADLDRVLGLLQPQQQTVAKPKKKTGSSFGFGATAQRGFSM